MMVLRKQTLHVSELGSVPETPNVTHTTWATASADKYLFLSESGKVL